MKFQIGNVVQCLWGSGTLKYESKIVRIDEKKPKTPYLVHYQGWNERWDEWVPEKRLIGASISRKSTSKSSPSISSSSKSASSSSKKVPNKRSRRYKEPRDISLSSSHEDDEDDEHDEHDEQKDQVITDRKFEPVEPQPVATNKMVQNENSQSKVPNLKLAKNCQESNSKKTSDKKLPETMFPVTDQKSPNSYYQFNQEEEPDFTKFQEPESLPRISPKSIRKQKEDGTCRRLRGVGGIKTEKFANKSTRKTAENDNSDDRFGANVMTNELETEGPEFIEIQEQGVKIPLVLSNLKKSKSTAKTDISIAHGITAQYEQMIEGNEFVEQDELGTEFTPPLHGITVTGSTPSTQSSSRVVMKLTAPDRARNMLRIAARHDGDQYMDRYYHPQMHVGGRGRFGVVGSGPSPIQPIPDRPEDFTYLPPEIVSDHCYGKNPPSVTNAGQILSRYIDNNAECPRNAVSRYLPTQLSSINSRRLFQLSTTANLPSSSSLRLRPIFESRRSSSPPGYRDGGFGFEGSLSDFDRRDELVLLVDNGGIMPADILDDSIGIQ